MVKFVSDKTHEKSILLVDDVNCDNIDRIQDICNKSSLIIKDKLPMPSSSDIDFKYDNRAVREIKEKLREVEQLVIYGKSKLFSNETQFRNFKIKVIFWCNEIFKNVLESCEDGEKILVTVQHEISKHEWVLLKWFGDIGISVLAISKNAETLDVSDSDNIKVILTHTYQNMQLVALKGNYDDTCYKSTEEIEQALYENKKTIKIIVSGISTYSGACDFYGKIHKESINNPEFVLIKNGFEYPDIAEIQKIPRLKTNKANEIIDILINCLKIKDNNVYIGVSNGIRDVFSSGFDNNTSILYNKLALTVCTLNKLFESKIPSCIVYYGKSTPSDVLILSVLSNVREMSLIVICSDKSLTPEIKGMTVLELESSTEIFDMPLVDNRECTTTLARQAENRVNETLYNGDTPGMYKPGQFRTCVTKPFSTTYDEIKTWWNTEMYIRPGFESVGDTAIIPTMFKVIKGVDSREKYSRMISDIACGKTVLCKSINMLDCLYNCGKQVKVLRGYDINNTLYNEQKIFYKNNKIQKQAIKNDRNYNYKFLDANKQDLILDKIELILNGNYINADVFNDRQTFIDKVLNVLLNLDMVILKHIQWFEYYTYNPNLILMLNTEKQLSAEQFILLLFLRLVGFDILIFVPTCFNSIENIVGAEFVYETHCIGEAQYSIAIDDINVNTSRIEPSTKKKGIFEKIADFMLTCI